MSRGSRAMRWLRPIPLALMAVLAACSDNTSLSARFTPSTTPPAPGLVKLVLKQHVDSQVIVDALIYGPQPALDLYAFQFGIAIGDPAAVRLVPHPSYPQSVLVAGAGQTVVVDVDASDPSLVRVNVTKQGGGSGNGFATPSALVIELTFEAKQSGSSTLAFVGLGANPPRVL